MKKTLLFAMSLSMFASMAQQRYLDEVFTSGQIEKVSPGAFLIKPSGVRVSRG